MEYLETTKKGGAIHIEGFPDAVEVLRLKGRKYQRLADLALHLDDLSFALGCLEAINDIPEANFLARQALWRSAVVHYIKCFGSNKGRPSSLRSRKIYKNDTNGLEFYRYFKSLRDKTVVHDDNAFTQCHVGAVLNKQEQTHKIAKVICFSSLVVTLDQANYNNLHRLITIARDWVVERHDELCAEITDVLEERPYEELLKMEKLDYQVPHTTDVHNSRKGLS